MPNDPKQKSSSTTQEISNDQNSTWRNLIGLWLIIASGIIIIALIVVAIVAIIVGGDKPFANSKELFNILLPVLGTWMGTVLAFYFSRENFEAANKSVNNLVNHVISQDEKLQEVKVADVMVKPTMFAFKLAKDMDELKKLNLLDLIVSMEKLQTERLPILQPDSQKFIFLIYRSTIERFITGVSTHEIKINGKEIKDIASIKDLTMNDMFESDYQTFKTIVQMSNSDCCYIPVTATLSDARKLMLDNSLCQDVFITKTGKKDEAVDGWVTNEMVIENADLFRNARMRY